MSKKFVITEEERNDLIKFIRSRNYGAAVGTLNQLEEMPDQTLKSDQDRTPGKEEGPARTG